MPSKSPSQGVTRRELPEVPPGTPEQLLEIARHVAGTPLSGHPCRDLARLRKIADRLEQIGQDLLRGLQQQVISPSAKAHEAQLKQVQRHAQALEKAIIGLPPFAQQILNQAYWMPRYWDPSIADWRDLGVGTASMAVAVSGIAEAVTKHLDVWRQGKVTGQVSPAQPGPLRAYQRIVGDPRSLMVREVAMLVLIEQSVSAVTAEECGAVYAAVGELWEWATGLSNEHANLRKHIRSGVRTPLLIGRKGEVETAIQDELTRFRTSPAEFKQPAAKRAFNQRLEALRAEHDQLMHKLFYK